jgi:hypothetical protein
MPVDRVSTSLNPQPFAGGAKSKPGDWYFINLQTPYLEG